MITNKIVYKLEASIVTVTYQVKEALTIALSDYHFKKTYTVCLRQNKSLQKHKIHSLDHLYPQIEKQFITYERSPEHMITVVDDKIILTLIDFKGYSQVYSFQASVQDFEIFSQLNERDFRSSI